MKEGLFVKKTAVIFLQMGFILISSFGGWLLSLTNLSIAWMIGTLFFAVILSFLWPVRLKYYNHHDGLPKYWLYIGQCLLGIQLGQKINLSVISIFKEHWAVIVVMLLLSIIFSLLSGFVLWKVSSLDMLTSFFAAAPGGLSSIPGIAEEVGANTGVVSVIQTMRIFLVVLMIPIAVSPIMADSARAFQNSHIGTPDQLEAGHILWTAVLIVIACLGHFIGRHLKFPAPWLIGCMLCVASAQFLLSSYTGSDMIAWWPHSLIVLSQILIAASIGSRLHRNMFTKLKGTLFIATLSTIGLILAMMAAAYFVSLITGISLTTAVLAFAPGGIAEMTTTAVVLHADATFVLAVQVLRVVVVCAILPPIFKVLGDWELKNNVSNHTEV